MLKIFSPYDKQLIKEIPQQSEADAESILDSAYSVFQDRKHWLSKATRLEILKKTYSIVEKRQDELAMCAATEGGKPLMDSKIESARAVSGIEIAIETLRTLHGEEIPMQLNAASEHRFAYTYHEPLGVVLGISAFNHPLNLIVHQVIPAIAAGCPVIIKPARTTPLSCLNLVNILYEAGLPKSWCQPLICENTITEKLVSDERISFLSFIGGSKVGWMLRSKLAAGTHCALEHGGSAPVILHNDADLADAIPLLVKGGFYHAGQVCVSVKRVFVHASILESVITAMTKQTKALKVGDPLNPQTEVGPLISEQEVNRVDLWVKEAIKQGATLLCGGEKLSNTCYTPTLLLNPAEQSHVSQAEIFGPVICLYSYTDLEDAITRANQLPFCFQAAIFTKSIDVAFHAAQQLKGTTVLVNDQTAFRVDWMPFGGRQTSGLGMGGIPSSIYDLSVKKMIVFRSNSL